MTGYLYTICWWEHDDVHVWSDMTFEEALKFIDRLTVRGCKLWGLSPQ